MLEIDMKKQSIVKKTAEKIPTEIYPTFNLLRITNPSRFFAIPILGFLVKVIISIPVFIVAGCYGIGLFFVIVIDSFIVLFTGKFWKEAYDFEVGMLRYSAKIYLYLFGLTNTYPGFDLSIHDTWTLDIDVPTNPNRFFAIPLFGFLARVILLIPYFIFEQVIGTAGVVAAFIAIFPILFKGKYPESLYELARDSVRIRTSAGMYMMGLSDSYPSFWISMNHQSVKVGLIIVGALLTFSNWGAKQISPNRFEDDSTWRNNDYPTPKYSPNESPGGRNTFKAL